MNSLHCWHIWNNTDGSSHTGHYVSLRADVEYTCGSACVEASSHHLWFMCYLVDVGQRLFVLDQHLGELQALVWIDTHHVSQQKHPVWGVAHL